MNSVSSNRIVIFSKSAERENVKTRMRPHLTVDQCLTFHVALLKDTLEKVKSLPRVLYLAGSDHLPFDPGVEIRIQQGADLGERMSNAMAHELQTYPRVVIIGTDAPAVSIQQMNIAFQLLTEKEVVLGPCDDGGYYLIGMSRMRLDLFQEIEWGTGTVFQSTVEKLPKNEYALLDPSFDVDVAEDLDRLKTFLDSSSDINLPNLRRWFAQDYYGSTR